MASKGAAILLKRDLKLESGLWGGDEGFAAAVTVWAGYTGVGGGWEDCIENDRSHNEEELSQS